VAPQASAPPVPSLPGQAVSTGRGVVYVGFAKLYFTQAGAGIEFLLPRILGDARFGAYAFVVAFVSVVNNVLITATIQAVSRFATQVDGPRVPGVLRAGLRMNVLVGAALTVSYLGFAVGLCFYERDFSKLWLLWLAGGVPLCYSLYAVFVGATNGTRQFHKQAGLDIGFSTTRAVLIMGGAALLGVWGAISGFVAAAAAILIAAYWVVEMPRALEREPMAPMMRYLFAVAAYQIFLNLAMHADLFILEHYMLQAAQGVTDLADKQIAYYRGVQNLARIPYQVLLAGTFIVFPLISRATFENDVAAARGYVRDTLRYSLIGAFALCVPFLALPSQVLGFFYPPTFIQGAMALPILALGIIGFVMFTIAGAILNGAGQTRPAIRLGALLVVSEIGLCTLALRGRGLGATTLAITAGATGCAYAIGAAVSGAALYKRYRTFVPPATAVRILLATGAAVALGHLLPHSGRVMTLLECAVVVGAYVTVLVVTREISKADLRARRRSPRPSSSTGASV
jgi:stage V sporulation protein B